MSNPTPAQEEFADFLSKNTKDDNRVHPEDRDSVGRHSADRSEDEEDRFRNMQIDSAMRLPTMDSRGDIKLPPAAFDANHATGVKGVIADARSYETARRMKWKERVRAARRSVFGLDAGKHDRGSGPDSDGSGPEDPDEESFLQQWRESRRRELESETRGPVVRNRRTSPSVRLYGRLDEVDAMGYLDAIEKVGRETVVVVFVYDHEVCVSCGNPSTLMPGANQVNSAPCRQPSRLHSSLWSGHTPLSISSRYITTISSSTMPPYQPFSPTVTRATCLPT
jgi:hypothetical protein